MAFGRPTKYWQLKPAVRARGGVAGWDRAVTEASDIYKGRMHNLLCDNCHSHVATALNLMEYDGATNRGWNMVRLAVLMFVHGKYVGWLAWIKTWAPFVIIVVFIVVVVLFSL